MKRLATIAVFLALAGPAIAAGIKNDGFESGDFTGWLFFGEGWRVSSYSKDSHRGMYGAVSDAWTNGMDGFRVVYQEVKASPGKTYRAEVWHRTVCLESSESFLEVQFLNRGGEVLSQYQSQRVKGNREFTLLAIEKMVAPDHTERASVRGVVNVLTVPVINTDYHIFDDFDFRVVTPADERAGR
jgi:hypothetical protein